MNYENGKKLQWSKVDLEQMKKDCNEISQQHGLSNPDKGEKITAYTKEKYKALERGMACEYKSYVLDCYKVAANARQTATSREDFVEKMNAAGYETTWTDGRKHITFVDKDGNKVRNTNLEKTFNEPFGKKELEQVFARRRPNIVVVNQALKEQTAKLNAKRMEQAAHGKTCADLWQGDVKTVAQDEAPFDASTVARRLEMHRAEFIKATMQAAKVTVKSVLSNDS